MVEKCPIQEGEVTTDRIPAICREQCGKYIDAAVEQGEIYSSVLTEDGVEPGCEHNNSEFSHDALARIVDSNLRNYVIVDRCPDCSEELTESDFRFECPFN